MKRLLSTDVEAICAAEGCRFNELFLVGDRVYVMLDVEDWRLPDKYRPLAMDDPAILSALPEVLRRLDATQFESMEALEQALSYKATHRAEFDALKYELHDLLTATSQVHAAPDGGQFYLELDGTSGEDLLLVCDRSASLDESLVASIQALLRNGKYALNWRVRVSFESDLGVICTIAKDNVSHDG